MDYGILPPEINSGRMYTGPGSASLVASAAAWQALTVELGMSGGSFGQIVSTLAAGPWLGPSSAAMLAASMPYVEWLAQTAAQAEQTAIAADTIATAFETAHASVIPPPMIAENRVRLATLVATNFMGVNSAAIAATEAEYEEFWAQDASTMYGFASEASAAANSLIPFLPPTAMTDPAGLAAQAASVGADAGQAAGQASANVGQATGNLGGMSSAMGGAAPIMSMAPGMMSAATGALHTLTSPMSSLGSLTSPLSSFGSFQSMLAPLMSMLNPVAGVASGAASGFANSMASLSTNWGGGGFGGMPTALMGRAENLPGATTKLSVPTSWVQNAQPAAKPVTALSSAIDEAAPDGVVMPPRPMVPAGAAAGDSGGGSSVIPKDMRGSLGMEPGRRPASLPQTTLVKRLVF